MGRQIKSGLEYFPFETKFFNDIKVRKLIKYQGGRSIVIYACLLCNIYEKGYYMLWDDEIPFLVSEKTGFEEGYIKEVIKCCFSVGLFDKNLYEKFKVVTSKGIQERYDTICKISKRKNQVEEFSLINSEEKPISSEEINFNPEETRINPEESTQSKEKKSKVNKRKEKGIDPPPPDFNQDSLFPEEKKDNPVNPDEEKERKKVAQKKESEIVDYFHLKCENLPRVQVLSDKRKTSIKTRLKEYGEEKVMKVIDMAGESKFLAGENNKNWKADFDWIFNSSNFIKIMEGNYKNRDFNLNTNSNGSSQARRR